MKNKTKIVIKDGYFSIESVGHAPSGKVCAAISMAMQMAVLGIKSLAAKYPNELEIEIDADPKKLL